MDLKTSFNMLGIDPHADDVQAKRAYKAQVRRWHPDQFPEGSATKAGAEERLKQINIAYARVKDHFATHRPTSRGKPSPPPSQGQRRTSNQSQSDDAKVKKRSWIDHLFGALNNLAGRHSEGTETSPTGQSPDRRKTFEQILKETAGAAVAPKPGRPSNPNAAACRRTTAGCRRKAGNVAAVGGTESVGPIKPVGRVRAIGRNR